MILMMERNEALLIFFFPISVVRLGRMMVDGASWDAVLCTVGSGFDTYSSNVRSR